MAGPTGLEPALAAGASGNEGAPFLGLLGTVSLLPSTASAGVYRFHRLAYGLRTDLPAPGLENTACNGSVVQSSYFDEGTGHGQAGQGEWRQRMSV